MEGKEGREVPCEVLFSFLCTVNSKHFHPKDVLGTCAPLRACLFAWEAIWGKILILKNLMRMGWSLVKLCILYKSSNKSINNILIRYDKTWKL